VKVRTRAWAGTLAACLVLAACSSPRSRQPPGPTFEGTFSAQFGPRTTVQGNEVPDTATTVTWVARSSCADTGCVAAATEVAPPDAEDPRPPKMIFDVVDGRWVSVRAVPSQCMTPEGESIDVQGWQAYSLERRPDGTLVGLYTNRSSVGGACHNSTQSVTVKRTGDADPDVEVGDPAAQPPRVSSRGSALWGVYVQTQTNPQTGQVYPPATYGGNTRCLRSGDRCLSYLVEPNTTALLVLTFADGMWTSTSAPDDSPCEDGGPGTSVLTGEFTLPQPVLDPIIVLTGTQRTVRMGACPGELTLDVRLDRTGDGPGR
jgi:serine/threonine-protein kinase